MKIKRCLDAIEGDIFDAIINSDEQRDSMIAKDVAKRNEIIDRNFGMFEKTEVDTKEAELL